MTQERIIFAGAGGQGLMVLGKLMIFAAMKEDFAVTWFPSYGAEVRGGTAHCHLVISSSEIYSPFVEKATSIVVMNEPSLKRFADRVEAGGLMVLNSSLAEPPAGKDYRIISVPATDIANDLGNIRVANIVMLGALNTARKLVAVPTLDTAIKDFLGVAKRDLYAINMEAYRRGCQFA